MVVLVVVVVASMVQAVVGEVIVAVAKIGGSNRYCGR